MKLIRDVQVPACHPNFAIPCTPGQGATSTSFSTFPCITENRLFTLGNHTPGFTAAAATIEAHQETLAAACGLAATGLKILAQKDFADDATAWWKEDMER